MKRLLSWALGGLAVVTAVKALFGTSEREEPTPRPPTAAATRRRRRQTAVERVRPVLAGTMGRIRDHHLTMLAGSLSYYAFLAVFPAAIAAVSIYGIVLSPAEVTSHIDSLTSALPGEIASIVDTQLAAIVRTSSTGLGVASVLGILGSLWSASAGIKSLMVGIDIAYDTPEDRSFLVLRGIALMLTLGSMVFVAASATVVTFLPDLAAHLGARDEVRRFIELGRWPAIFLVVVGALGILYKIAPNRPARRSPWLSMGALLAAVLWIAVTFGFSFYVGRLTNFNATYGALGTAIVLLLWFFLSGLVVLVGAELNAELESRR
ncbi:MAG: YihY/virulence factor BrkB family protein [Acidimicrobiia bacterium]